MGTLSKSVENSIKRNHSKTKQKENPKFRLHNIASRILLDRKFNTKIEQLSIDGGHYPYVTQCNKVPFISGNKVRHVEGVILKKSTEFENHYYFGGLLHCGNVWACPICSEKISQFRAQEIADAFDIWREIGEKNKKKHAQLMVTFTIPHYANQSVDDLRSSFMKVRRNLKKQTQLRKNPSFVPYEIIKEKFGIKGMISGIEVTWGYNGWHPHSHDIFFMDRDLSFEEYKEFKAYLTTAWIYAYKRAKISEMRNEKKALLKGKTKKQKAAIFKDITETAISAKQEKDMYEKSVDVRRAATAEEYIAKFGKIDYKKHKDILNPGWGAANEITKSHLKRSILSGSKHFSPWDMLRIIDQFPNDQVIYLKFGKLFREYVRAFKGSRQLFWSKDFKDYLSSQFIYYQTLRKYSVFKQNFHLL